MTYCQDLNSVYSHVVSKLKNHLIEIKYLTFTLFKHINKKVRSVFRNYIKLIEQEKNYPKMDKIKNGQFFS
jgi:hypothetical protein